jgi:hypothetical protein
VAGRFLLRFCKRGRTSQFIRWLLLPCPMADTAKMGGGKDVVTQWVEKFDALPLDETFRGIIDRDNGDTGGPRIEVSGRYTIENYLLDPIVVFALLISMNSCDLPESLWPSGHYTTKARKESSPRAADPKRIGGNHGPITGNLIGLKLALHLVSASIGLRLTARLDSQHVTRPQRVTLRQQKQRGFESASHQSRMFALYQSKQCRHVSA